MSMSQSDSADAQSILIFGNTAQCPNYFEKSSL
jgi:hypothetical protein